MKIENLFDTVKDWSDLKNKMMEISNQNPSFVGKNLFELFAKYYFLCSPTLQNDYQDVWLYNEIPNNIKESLNLPNQDYGIDLLLKGKDDLFYAVQCKFKVDDNTKLNWTKDKIGNFFGSTNSVHGYIVFSNAYTIDNVSSSRSQNFQFISISDLLELDNNFFYSVCSYIEGNKQKKLNISPKPHQIEAIKSALEYYSNNSRGKLILPCGAGKTITSLWISEALNAQLILITLPSLALVRQFKNEWKKYTNFEFNYICVCSDEDIDADEDVIKTRSYEVDIRTTNQPKIILNFISKKVGKKIIFSTYQSVDKAIKAVKGSDIVFDLAICDEAHRTAGVRKTDIKKTNYTIIHDDNEIKIKKRLYMTATPRVAGANARTRAEKDDDVYLYCMDDEKLYGKEFFRMSFAQAIEAEILVDYRIVAVGVEKQEISEYLQRKRLELPNYSLDDIANNYALEHIMDKYDLKHSVTFHARVRYAENFKKIHKEISNKTDSFVVSGEDSMSVRNQILNSFRKSDRAVISNARCLTEGVDIPVIDMVFFCDPKNSKVDIVQAAGRALRKAEGKTLGYIVIPIYHSNKDGVEKIIDDSSFKRLTEVIKAISDHDDRLQEEIDSIAVGKKSFDSNSKIDIVKSRFTETLHTKITILNFGDELKKSIFTEIIEKTYNNWNCQYQRLKEFYLKEGQYPESQDDLYKWIQIQKRQFYNYSLSEFKIKKLDKISFLKHINFEKWIYKFNYLKEFLKSKKRFPRNVLGETILFSWCEEQKTNYHNLSKAQINFLTEIEFIRFLDPWESSFKELENFVLKNNTLPKNDGYAKPIRQWLDKQKKMLRAGVLYQKQNEKLTSLPLIREFINK